MHTPYNKTIRQPYGHRVRRILEDREARGKLAGEEPWVLRRLDELYLAPFGSRNEVDHLESEDCSDPGEKDFLPCFMA